MAYRNRLPCFICDVALNRNQMARIDGDDNENKREIAKIRRDALEKEIIEITDRTRICLNCNRSILNELNEIERDPNSLRLNVLCQTSSHTCMFCGDNNNIQRFSLQARVNVFVVKNIYICTRIC